MTAPVEFASSWGLCVERRIAADIDAPAAEATRHEGAPEDDRRGHFQSGVAYYARFCSGEDW